MKILVFEMFHSIIAGTQIKRFVVPIFATRSIRVLCEVDLRQRWFHSPRRYVRRICGENRQLNFRRKRDQF